MAVLASEQALDLGHGARQLRFPFGQPCGSITGGAGLPDDFRAPARPFRGRNEIRVWIGIAPTVRHPDIPGAQRTAQVPQGT